MPPVSVPGQKLLQNQIKNEFRLNIIKIFFRIMANVENFGESEMKVWKESYLLKEYLSMISSPKSGVPLRRCVPAIINYSAIQDKQLSTAIKQTTSLHK